MRRIRFYLLPDMLSQAFKALLTVGLTTVILFFIGRRVLGEGVIALLYLVPVGWSASRWGQAAGMSAALAAALTFDFLFIPPFFTFTIASIEGVMILVIFLSVAILVVGRIQSALSRALTSEREAIFMYELSSALSRTADAGSRSPHPRPPATAVVPGQTGQGQFGTRPTPAVRSSSRNRAATVRPTHGRTSFCRS